MNITNETKIGDLIPKDFELDKDINYYTGCIYGKITISLKKKQVKESQKLTSFQDECCPSCGQYIGHAIGCPLNIAQF